MNGKQRGAGAQGRGKALEEGEGSMDSCSHRLRWSVDPYLEGDTDGKKGGRKGREGLKNGWMVGWEDRQTD